MRERQAEEEMIASFNVTLPGGTSPIPPEVSNGG
jgi:hypothetical protein